MEGVSSFEFDPFKLFEVMDKMAGLKEVKAKELMEAYQSRMENEERAAMAREEQIVINREIAEELRKKKETEE